MQGKNYSYNANTLGICYIWSNKGEFLGSVWVDQHGGWNTAYEDGVKYLPINSALNLLGYMSCQDVELE